MAFTFIWPKIANCHTQIAKLYHLNYSEMYDFFSKNDADIAEPYVNTQCNCKKK